MRCGIVLYSAVYLSSLITTPLLYYLRIALIRFLKAHCRRDDGTYILRQSTDGEALQLYDLGLASYSKQKHFKWMLAMLSYRFAIRLGHHIKIATVRCRAQIRQRQMHLFSRYHAASPTSSPCAAHTIALPHFIDPLSDRMSECALYLCCLSHCTALLTVIYF